MLGDNDLQTLYGGHVDAWGGNPVDLERFVEAKKISMDEFRIVAEGPALPNDVLVAHPKLSTAFIEDVRNRMVMRKMSRVRVLQGYQLELESDDGVSGTVDLADLVGKGVFALW